MSGKTNTLSLIRIILINDVLFESGLLDGDVVDILRPGNPVHQLHT